MIELELNEILKATGGYAKVVLPDTKVKSIITDSRKAEDGAVFVALKGERVDGHSFINGIIGRILAAVVENEVDSEVPQIVVPSTYGAIRDIGAYIREKSGVTVIGVTGSVGKTSVKELTAAVVSQRFNTLKTEKNHNNELGLPMTLFRLTEDDEAAVLEMGISYFGEMTRLSRIARPDIAIFTNIENVHTENLIDRDGVLQAKTELVANMHDTRGGVLILNGEDDKLRGYQVPDNRRAVYYGFDKNFFAYADNIVPHGIESTDFTLHLGEESIRVELPASGMHMVLNALAAAAAGHEMGLTISEIKRGLESFVQVEGRMTKIDFNGATIINDCYNASPTSMAASLTVLKEASGRKLALLGDMLELGERTEELHRGIGALCAELKLDVLVTVGELAGNIASEARKNGLENVCAVTKEEAAKVLKSELKPGDTLLVKASRGMALETVIKAITED
ncbi:MAG: UDP-N-acetylmuramoyl-tripeptide--D-alanyl-D-alanine ligase [Clostridiales bacterium]|nr:UDP-N-acetylmuramoyl-tripeptide--D-alanyl-D-alanine ligase [Clostridiales bacterium]